MKFYPLPLLMIALLSGTVQGQELTKKEAAKADVKSVTVYETNLLDKKAKPAVASMDRYDSAGNLIEILVKDNTGAVTKHESYEYNDDGQKTVEIQYEPDGKIRKKHLFKYNNGLRSERLTYDREGKLISQKKYVYEFNK